MTIIDLSKKPIDLGRLEVKAYLIGLIADKTGYNLLIEVDRQSVTETLLLNMAKFNEADKKIIQDFIGVQISKLPERN